MANVRQKRALIPSEPLRGVRGAAKIVNATPQGHYVVQIDGNEDFPDSIFAVVDQLGYDVNTGKRRVWNPTKHRPALTRRIGETVYSLRIGRGGRAVFKGTIRGIENHRYLVEVPGFTNASRQDGLYIMSDSTAYSTLDEVEERLNVILDEFAKMRAAEAGLTTAAATVRATRRKLSSSAHAD